MKKSVTQFIYSLSVVLNRIGEVFVKREPGYFERRHRFTIKRPLLNKWSNMFQYDNSPERFLKSPNNIRFATSTHTITLPYHNGIITVYRIGSIVEFQNWPHYRRSLDESREMVRGNSIKATGRVEAIRKLNDIDFLRKVRQYVPGIKQDIAKILLDFGPYDLIIISHTKALKYVLEIVSDDAEEVREAHWGSSIKEVTRTYKQKTIL